MRLIIENIIITILLFGCNSSTKNKDTLSIDRALAVTDLTVNHGSWAIGQQLPESPDKSSIVECFKNEFKPKAEDFFNKMLYQALSSTELRNGAELANKSSVIRNYDFIMTNSLLYGEEAKQNGKRLDSYLYILASKKADKENEKKELLEFSKWVDVNGPKFSDEIIANIKEHHSDMSNSLDSCLK